MDNAALVASTALQIFKLGIEAVREINKLLSSGSGEHHLVVGQPEVGDILLHSDQKSEGGEGRHVFQYSGKDTITAVVAKDNWDNDTGGYPKIISGGPGYKHVEVEVTSRSCRGFDHTFQVYGKKRKSKKCNLI